MNSSLPTATQPWPLSQSDMKRAKKYIDPEEVPFSEVREYARNKACLWPGRRLYFLCDIHADTDAFLLSLRACGGIVQTGPGDSDFELTAEGADATFIVGGDCFDKGPDNLRLLRCLKALMDKGAQTVLLAGNHDLRTYLGIAYAGRREIRFAHLFVRMGRKTIPLLRQLLDDTEPSTLEQGEPLSDDQIVQELLPSQQWYQQFANEVSELLTPQRIDKELRRIREKTAELLEACAEAGLTLSDVRRALLRARAHFLEPDGEFAWYFRSMRLAYRQGSFLFVHAGVDDTLAAVLRDEGVDGLNGRYEALVRDDLFELYNGPVGNAFRTKYRDIDFPLTDTGRQALHSAGIYAIVHGHRNILRGQRLTLRAGILNFECDSSVDCNTRRLEGLAGPGGAALVFHPAGHAAAISTDYPFIKQFQPEHLFGLTTLSHPPMSGASSELSERVPPPRPAQDAPPCHR